MWIFMFSVLVLIFSVRTAFLSLSYFKNKKRGGIPLLLVSVLCLLSPFLSVLIGRLILLL